MKLLALFICSMLFVFNAAAKYDPPKNSYGAFKTESDYISEKFIERYGDDQGNLDKKKFKNKKITKEEERQNRRKRKKGIFLTPEQEFDLMDADKDQKVTKEEIKAYYEKKEQDRPKTKDELRRLKQKKK